MKIDRSRIKKSTLEVPPECQALIEKLWLCSQGELLQELKKIDTWTFGKCELYHWIEILDVCDNILEHAARRAVPKSWQLVCDLPGNDELKELLLWVLHFTTLLIEHSFSRHLYNSVEHLLTLLSSCDLHVVLGVLNLLYMFSKRSNFIARLMPDMRSALLKCLTYLAESWGGRENGFGLADCCRDVSVKCPASATTVHYEFYSEETPTGRSSQVSCIHLENVDKLDKTPAEIMNSLIEAFNVPTDGQMLLFTHLRLAYSFSDYRQRLDCVQARLQALSVLLYSNSFTEIQNLLYPGILDELVELLELQDPQLVEIRAAALRTLTSITHLDRSPRIPLKPGSRLNMIIDVTGAGLYHGFLPQMVRNCITSLTTDKNCDKFPLPLATALFSFLYHLASYEAGGEALVSCGMMECLLRVINWPGNELEHITFVTRAVRVIDLITNIDMQAFQVHGGLSSFINRLQMEMTICRQEQPFEIQVASNVTCGSDVEMDEEVIRINVESEASPSTSKAIPAQVSTSERSSQVKSGKTCLPQRAALLKSMLNFLKKALPDPSFSENMRNVMDGSLPSSLKHIISNAEYYGPSLFLLATDVVTAYVFQEPQYLSSLQDNGLTDVVLHALLVKNVPATREVLGSLPNVFSALCLNPRGLASFVKYSPFEKLFKVLLSPMYLSAMRRRRSTDPIGDTASNLGNAMDELMRHQPTLKADATAAIIKLLEELCALGRDPKYICWRPQKGSNGESSLPTPRVANEAGSSDEEEDDEEEASTSSHPQREDTTVDQSSQTTHEKTPIALVDYILNVMKFVDAILSNNSTDDHCREFVSQKGLDPLLSILGLPNLPVDYPVTLAAQSVASVCKSILNLAHEPQVMRTGLQQLHDVLIDLLPLYKPSSERPEGSLLFLELCSVTKLETAFSTPSATPLLHAVAAANGYVVMFVHVCRTGQLDIRTISMTHWGSELGLRVLKLLCELYTALVWESTILLALCSDEAPSKLSKEDIEKLCPPGMKLVEDGDANSHMTSAMEALSTESGPTSMEVDEQNQQQSQQHPTKKKGTTNVIQMKYIKPLLGASSRLGRALAELFGLLVKLCVGFPVRTRRGNHLSNTPVSPTPAAQDVAKMLANLLSTGLNWKSLPPAPLPKFRLTYLICSVGFTSPMLFDEKKFPYHLMLQKFVQCGGQKSFFDTFYWAVSGGGILPLESGLEHPELPDGTGEFLDAWLILLEKMVNPKAILDTTHMLPTKTTQQGVEKMFDPLKYLQNIHRETFNSIKLLWGKKPLKTYGPRMIESVLTIMRHILRGEKLIEERRSKEEKSNGRDGNESRRLDRPDVNLSELQQLMDMGFSREHCYEALILTNTMEHATDYLLNNFFPHNLSRSSIQQPSMETEEDQLYQAIAMSLGDSGQSPADTETPMSIEDEVNIEPLKKEELDKFTEHALPVCLGMLEKLPDTVYHVCALLNTILRRNGEMFSYKLLNALAGKITNKVDYLLNACRSLSGQNSELLSIFVHSLEAHRAAAIIHLYMLLFEEIKVPCAKIVHTSSMLPKLIKLLSKGTAALAACQSTEKKETPKWLAPLLLLIDLLEKVSIVANRKSAMHKLTTHVWRWFDLATGKWTLYSPLNNKLINESYWRGDNVLRIASGRRRYTIIFHQMVQTSEDSGKQRPIMRTLIEYPKEETVSNDGANETFSAQTEKSSSFSSAESMEVEGDSDFFYRRSAILPIEGVTKEAAKTIVKACVGLMDIPVNKDTLHAAMQLCVRFTRDYENAKIVAEMGVVKILLKLRHTSVFTGFTGLATILIRHILEDPVTLELAFEKVLRAKTLANIPPSYKEMHYILRECSSAICRDTDTLRRVAERILRVDLNALNKRNDDDDSRLLMKSIVPKEGRQMPSSSMIEETSKQTVFDLLNALAVIPDEEIEDNLQDKNDSAVGSDATPTSSSSSSSDGTSSSRRNGSSAHATTAGFDHGSNSRNGGHSSSQNVSFPDLLAEQGPLNGASGSTTSLINYNHNTISLPFYMVAQVTQAQTPTSGTGFQNELNDSSEKMKKFPLLTKSAILKILGDAVRSYTNIAKLITNYIYSSSEIEVIKEDCSAIAFVLDHLMPTRDGMTDHELPNMARGLIAALSSCNHSPDAQLTLVSEIKSALTRTLALPESSRKHQHIQDLVGIVTIMIENCPPVPINTPLTSALKLSQFSVNNMVRFMMRKGIITDLSRIPHSLDLSSPKMATTMNAVLKPLESLSRIMSCPSTVASAATAKLKAKRTISIPITDEQPSTQTVTSVSEPTNAQGEETVEDTDNTEHDVSATVDICSEEPINPPDEPDTEGDADEMIEHLIDRVVPTSNDADAGEGNRTFIFDESLEPIENSNDLTTQQMGHNEEASESSSDDSDSNGSEEERHIYDTATDIDDQVDDEEDEAEGDDTEIPTGHFAEEVLEMIEAEQGLLGIPGLDNESDDFFMIEYFEPSGSTPLYSWNPNNPLFGLFEDPPNANENASLNQIPSMHPLLMTRQNVEQGGLPSSRNQRLMTRTRRYQLMTHQNEGSQLFGAGSNNSSNTSSNNDVISSALGNNTRVVVMDNGLGIFTNSEEEQINFVDQSGYLLGPSLAATLNNVPTSMHWWNEEARILDGDSQADCAIVMGFELAPIFIKYRNEELAERREKQRKEKQDDEHPKKMNTDSDKKKIYSQEMMNIFESNSRTPLRPATRRIAMLTAAQEVAQATENLAGSIVESVLHPRAIEPPPARQQPSTSYVDLPAEPAEPQLSSAEEASSDTLTAEGTSDAPASSRECIGSVSPPLPLFPILTPINITALSQEELMGDPLGLIPGSVPFPPPADPDDGFFRVNQSEDDSQSQSQRTQQDQQRTENNGFSAFPSAALDMTSSTPSSTSSPPFVINTVNMTPMRRVNMTPMLHRVSEDSPLDYEFTVNNWLLPSLPSITSIPSSAQQSSLPPPPPPPPLPPPLPPTVHSINQAPQEQCSTAEGPEHSDNMANNEGSRGGRRRTRYSHINNEPETQLALLSEAAATLEHCPEVPEGVDPSFLAALPDELRSEVISEHLRLQRLRNRAEAQSQSGDVNRGSTLEVNPDFLAALPPNIQEEVLAQQRLEQQRQAATTSNPNEPVDAAAFFQDLPHALRQAILTDMEESQMSVLPPEIVAEAQNLRREWEARNRQLIQERFLSHVTHNTTALSSILRTSTPRSGSRQTAGRYAIQSVSPRSPWAGWPARQDQQTGMSLCAHSRTSNVRSRGRQILDYETICCLLVLLFVDDSRLNTVRLHRVFRNLCYHAPTRDWIIKALLSIMEKSNEGVVDNSAGVAKATAFGNSGGSSGSQRPISKRMTTRSQSQIQTSESANLTSNANVRNASSWLNISMDAALGCRATVFHVQKLPGRRTEKTVTINPQAAPFVYRHALDILISLAKTFPSCFIPSKTLSGEETSSSNTSNKSSKSNRDSSNFWDLLIRLDSASTRKGKGATRSFTNPAQDSDLNSLEMSPFGQLLKMLAAPVVSRSSVLMDKLLRLLSLISVGLQVNKERILNTTITINPSSSSPNNEPIISTNTLNHLALVIKVLTSNTCSEEGLEDATALLLNMSTNIESIRDTVLKLLLQGARNMAENVCVHINNLLTELRELNKHSHSDDLEDSSVDSKVSNTKGILSNRFTKETVVVTAPKKVKTSLDLQLTSMAPLISKTSSQAFFLRILKVIAQMRESVQNLERKKSDNSDDFELECEAECDAEAASADKLPQQQHLSEHFNLDHLWDTLSSCLTELAHTQDSHAVLVLQPAVEAFFLVHSCNDKKQADKERSDTSSSNPTGSSSSQGLGDELAPAPRPLSPLPPTPICSETVPVSSQSSTTSSDTSQRSQQKFLKFAETHRTVLNQILRQCNTPLLEGPFAVLVNHTRVLDFDVKRRYFRNELERADEGHRREELAVHVRRSQVFEDSFRELHRRSADDWKNRFYIVFEGEEGQDAGGLLREWYMIISREIFNPMYALFTTSPGDRVTYMINPASHCNHNHLCYFKFVGRVIAKAIYDNKLLECYFTRSLYKHILGIPVKYTDMESEDYTFYQSLVYMMENHISSLGYDLSFSTEVQEFGVTEVRDLLPNGRNILVNEENKMDYIQLVCKMKTTGAIRQQLQSFLEGFYEIIPKKLISIFNEQELELLISGLPNVDIDELKSNTEYYKYQPNSLQIQWFWRALREFDQAERAKFLQFVTGTSKVPLQGFGALEGMNGTQKFQIHRDERSTDRLPSAHTCFNQLDLPVYETYTKLRTYLLKAIHECSEGFGFA